jgi:hypothetical protein
MTNYDQLLKDLRTHVLNRQSERGRKRRVQLGSPAARTSSNQENQMTIILELTDAEASALATITLRGIRWQTPKIGKAAQDIYYALADADVTRTPDVRYNRFAEFTVEEES